MSVPFEIVALCGAMWCNVGVGQIECGTIRCLVWYNEAWVVLQCRDCTYGHVIQTRYAYTVSCATKRDRHNFGVQQNTAKNDQWTNVPVLKRREHEVLLYQI